MLNDLGVEDLSLEELDELFNDDNGKQETPPAGNDGSQGASPADKDVKKEETKAFAKRLKEKTDQAILNEREAIAKSMGYSSYAEMQKKREEQLLEEKGLDPEQVAPVVEELVKQRLNDDPRIKELEVLRNKQIQEFGKRELEEITKLTNGEITNLSQLSPEVINLWKKKGSLKSAYMELEGEKLINKYRSEQSKGSTDHLGNVGGNSSGNYTKRPLTEEEKRVWRLFNPNITTEELNKKTIDVK